MNNNVDAASLRAMLLQVSKTPGAMGAAGTAPFSAAAFFKNQMSTEQWNAAGMLMDGAALPKQTLLGLYDIVLPFSRPASVVSQGDFKVGAPWEHLGSGALHSNIRQALRAVGLLLIPGSIEQLAGTGFLVGADLVITNRHVASIFARGLNEAQPQWRDEAPPVIDFHREVTSPPGDTSGQYQVERVLMVHPTLDIVLLRLAARPAITPLTLASAVPVQDDEIAVLGYPGSTEPAGKIERQIFQDIYNVKRMAPGQIRSVLHSANDNSDILTHDSSTLRGNSGSPALDPRSGHVVGVHFSNDDMLKLNLLVSSASLGQSKSLRDAGVQFA